MVVGLSIMKTIIITGGTSGIGLNLAEYFYKKIIHNSCCINKRQIKNLKINLIKKSLFLNLNLIKKRYKKTC